MSTISVKGNAIRWVNIADLNVDSKYQRDVAERAQKRLKSDFMEEALGTPMVGQRDDDTFWIVDGLQRITTLKNRGETEVRVEIFRSRGPAHEATVFAKINGNRTKLSSYTLFNARVTQGDKTALSIVEAVNRLGFQIPRTVKRGGNWKALACPRMLYDTATTTGSTESIEWALNVISKAWPEDPLATKEAILAGLFLYYRRRNGVEDADTERLIKNCTTTTPSKVLYSANMGIGDRASNVADQLEKIFRKRGRRA